MNKTLFSIAKSWCETARCVHSTEDILTWVRERNEMVAVDICKTDLAHCTGWFYDEGKGCILNQNQSFFMITGVCRTIPDYKIQTQPIIIQAEIGYLGILCHEFDGVMHFLMQAKIEPGNVNKIQISPTIQATKSNFTRKHGGERPHYLDYFLNASKHEIVVDQIQSEQSSRFYKKRNRNIIVRVDDDIDVLPSHRWMTLGQIKRLMREDNLVNMDTRTVLSCIPYSKLELSPLETLELSNEFEDKTLFRSLFIGEGRNLIPNVYHYINNQKMFDESTTEKMPLHKLLDWEMKNGEFVCKHSYPFKVVFCDIAIEGREVRHWAQPLFEANGIATYGLALCEENGILKILVKAKPEIGCFDVLELGPTVQCEATGMEAQNEIDRFFLTRMKNGKGIVFDHLLSEEGGRFYHEQNRNVLLRVNSAEIPALPEGYFLIDLRTLNELVQVNNTMNIQLRNLLSLL